MNFYLIQTLKFEIILAKIHGEIFSILCQLTKRLLSKPFKLLGM
jgi:hypothetical protein